MLGRALSGARQLTSRAFLTFVTVDKTGGHRAVPPLLLESEEDGARRRGEARRAERLKRRRRTAAYAPRGRGRCGKTTLPRALRLGANLRPYFW